MPFRPISDNERIWLLRLRDSCGSTAIKAAIKRQNRGAPKKIRTLNDEMLVDAVNAKAAELREKGSKRPVKEAVDWAYSCEFEDGRRMSRDSLARYVRRGNAKLRASKQRRKLSGHK